MTGPALLVHLDSRDVGVYERLVNLGYRLLGYPASLASVIGTAALPIEGADLDAGDTSGAEPMARELAANVAAALHHPHLLPVGLESPEARAAVAGSLVATIQLHAARAIAEVDRFLDFARRERVALVVVRDELSHTSKAHIVAARRLGIPSLHLMHHVPWLDWLDGHHYADMAALYGSAARAFLLRRGAQPGGLAITGNPVWDGYRNVVSGSAEDAKRTLGLEPDVPAVLYAASVASGNLGADFFYPDWPWQHYEATVRALAAVHQRRPLQLMVKLHPGEQDEHLWRRSRALAQQAGVPAIALTGQNLPQFLLAADVVVCLDSNIGIEAMMLDRPVVNLRLGNLFEGHLFEPEDAVIEVTDAASLPAAIEAALCDPETQRALAARRPHSAYRFNYLGDGRAAERVAQLVDSVLNPARAARRLAGGAAAPLVERPSSLERESTGRQHLEQAQRLLQGANFRGTALVAGQALTFLDGDAAGSAHFLQGYALLQLGEAAAARDALAAAVRLQPGQPSFASALAAALVELGDLAAAERVLQDALVRVPDDADLLANRDEVAELLADARAERGTA